MGQGEIALGWVGSMGQCGVISDVPVWLRLLAEPRGALLSAPCWSTGAQKDQAGVPADPIHTRLNLNIYHMSAWLPHVPDSAV